MPSQQNILSLDYAKEAKAFASVPGGLIDMHSHINGNRASLVYHRVAQAFNVTTTFSMTPLEGLDELHPVARQSIHHIAVPNFHSCGILVEQAEGYRSNIDAFYKRGARIAKFFGAPRLYDFSDEPFHKNCLRLDAPARLETMQYAADLGMAIMIHIGDPDIWFADRYSDSERYGTKAHQYDILANVLHKIKVPVLAAHMAGSPEDLTRLAGLLHEFPNLHLDCSATKWMIRELSKHHPDSVRQFFETFAGRILFGSDIITAEAHLQAGGPTEIALLANSQQEAFDLYASRYFALRKYIETDYHGPSPIRDGDSPQPVQLRGMRLAGSSLNALYRGAAETFLEQVGITFRNQQRAFV